MQEVNIELVNVEQEKRHVLERLLELYVYDFTEYMDFDLDDNGLFTYPLDEYFNTSANHHAYFITSNSKLCGFVLVKRQNDQSGQPYYSIGEFFILKKYRRLGLGREVARRIFDKFPGRWIIYQSKNNYPAQVFWKAVILDFSRGDIKELLIDEKPHQEFEV